MSIISNSKTIMTHEEWINAMRKMKNRKPTFPVLYEECKGIKNIERVHSMQHLTLLEIVNGLNSIPEAKECLSYVLVFGSSVTTQCSVKSDLDIGIKLKDCHKMEDFDDYGITEVNRIIVKATKGNCDILYLDDGDVIQNEDLYKNMMEGVKIWEC